MSEHLYLAMDYGAESGRAELVRLEDGRVRYEELHRFANRPVHRDGTMHWNYPYLFEQLLESLKRCAARGLEPQGIGVDTWGVDFGLLDGEGRLLDLPVCYRDKRTADAHATSPMPLEEIFQETGCEPWPIGTLFQLHVMRRDDSPLLRRAARLLHMPDLFNYELTGVAANEKTIVSTGCLMTVDGQWSKTIIRRFDLPDIFHDQPIEPGTVLGPLKPSLQQQCGLGAVPVVASCGHDTSAVAATVGRAAAGDWAFLSCGTWSILGADVDEPLRDRAVLEAGFTNEYTLGRWFCGRNILGLWLVQELKRRWDAGPDRWDYARITAEAEAAGPTDALVDVTDSALLAPENMEQALLDQLKRNDQPCPAGRGQLVRCVLQSLALEYDVALRQLGRYKGRPVEALYMVGGGTKNHLLCQFTADASGLPVHAGIDQCTALGNALTVAVGLGHVQGIDQVRRIMADSFQMTTYQPQDEQRWESLRRRYAQLTGR